MPPSALYAAEDQWSAVLDRGGQVDFFGSRIDVPMQRRFGDIASVRAYVDRVLELPAVRAGYPSAGPVQVRERSGQRRAHYEPGTATIAVPMRDLWGGREAVVLHELAHHLACSVGRSGVGIGAPLARCGVPVRHVRTRHGGARRAGRTAAQGRVRRGGGAAMSATLDRISALLAKAERTDNEAEADAYLMKAQQLATLASVDLAVARARIARREARQQPESRTTTIGEKARRANPHLISLFVAIAHANDAQVDVASNSTYVIGYGMPADLDVVETIFASLAVHMVHSSQSYVTERTWVGETYVAAAARGRRGQRRPHTAQTARAAFYRAYVERISERLAVARQEALAQVARERPPRTGDEMSGGVLVLRHKAAEVRSFHAQQSRARGSWSGYSGAVRRASGTAAEAGRGAASRARLTQQAELPAKGPGIRG